MSRICCDRCVLGNTTEQVPATGDVCPTCGADLLRPRVEAAYKERYGVDWYDCLSDAGGVRGLPPKDVLWLIVGRMFRLICEKVEV